jgi:hypothetical protein
MSIGEKSSNIVPDSQPSKFLNFCYICTWSEHSLVLDNSPDAKCCLLPNDGDASAGTISAFEVRTISLVVVSTYAS